MHRHKVPWIKRPVGNQSKDGDEEREQTPMLTGSSENAHPERLSGRQCATALAHEMEVAGLNHHPQACRVDQREARAQSLHRFELTLAGHPGRCIARQLQNHGKRRPSPTILNTLSKHAPVPACSNTSAALPEVHRRAAIDPFSQIPFSPRILAPVLASVRSVVAPHPDKPG